MNDSSITRSYSDIAAGYNKNRFTGENGRFLRDTDRRIIRKLLQSTQASRIVDVPVGTGRVLEYVDDLDYFIIGVDATTEMLQEAAKVADRERHFLVKGNAAALPFQDAGFDCLISLRFFHLFSRSQRLRFAREFCRVVKPGGFAIVSFTNGWYGGGINWLKQRSGRKTVFFEHSGEVKQLFPNWRIRKQIGNFLPKQWWLDRIPGVGAALRIATEVTPLNRMCWEKFYLLEKPSE